MRNNNNHTTESNEDKISDIIICIAVYLVVVAIVYMVYVKWQLIVPHPHH